MFIHRSCNKKKYEELRSTDSKLSVELRICSYRVPIQFLSVLCWESEATEEFISKILPILGSSFFCFVVIATVQTATKNCLATLSSWHKFRLFSFCGLESNQVSLDVKSHNHFILKWLIKSCVLYLYKRNIKSIKKKMTITKSTLKYFLFNKYPYFIKYISCKFNNPYDFSNLFWRLLYHFK